MPTFEISLDDGRKFHVDADNAEAAQAGIQHVLGQGQPQQAGGVLDAAKQGASGLLSGLGETGQRYFGAGQALKDAGTAIAPKNQADTTLYDDKGLHAENIPNALAASSPSVAAALAAARLMPGPIWAKLAAGGAVGLGSMAGNYAKEATAKRTGDANAPSSPEDLAEGLKRGVPEAALQALPLGGLIGGRVAGLGLKGVAGSGLRALGDAAAMGAGNAASEGYDQLYQGDEVDPNKAINAGLTGALVGGTFGAGRTLQDAKAAVKFRGIADEDPTHVQEAANRVKQAADNLDLRLRNQKEGDTAIASAQSDVNTEFKSTLDALKNSNTTVNPQTGAKTKTPIPQDVQNILARAQKGLPLGDSDTSRLASWSGNQSAVDDLTRLGGVSRSLEGVNGISNGLSSAMERQLNVIRHPIGALGLAGAHELGGMGLSLPVLGGLTGAYALARFNDAITGNRSRANAFTSRFADGSGVPAPNGNNQPQANGPQGPAAPNAPGGGGPGLAALNALAAGPQPAAPPFNAAAMKPAVQAVIKARMNALAMQNAQQNAAPAAPAAAPAEAPFNGATVSKQLASVLKARQWADQMRQQFEASQEPAPAPAEAPPAPVDLSAMKGPVQAVLRARMNALAMQAAAEKQSPDGATALPAPPAAPAPDLSGLKGAVRDALKARMNVIDMQNKDAARVAPPDAANSPVELPAFLPKRGQVPPQAPVIQAAPTAAPSVPPEVSSVPPVQDLSKLVPVVTKLTKSKGKVEQKVEQKPAPAQAPQAPQPAPPVPPQAPAAPVMPPVAPQFRPGSSVDDGIPDFLRRAPQPAAPPVATPAPQVQVATKALAKLNGSKPVEKASTDAELAMSPRDYADHAMKSMFVRQGSEDAVRAAIEQRDQWKRDTAQKLASITGQKEAVLFKKLREAQYRQPIEHLRDFLTKKHPDDADAINTMLSDAELRKVWKYGAPKK